MGVRSRTPWPHGARLALGAVLVLAVACRDTHSSYDLHASEDLGWVPADEEVFHVPPPPFTEGAFPCSRCHSPETPRYRERRTLRFAHTEIELHHAEGSRWCLDCHDAENRDRLHLANGELVPFDESYRLCGQCHGDKFRDWRAGVHGRRTGEWNGEKSYLLCVHCHDAHSPTFKPIEPLPAPTRPRRTP